MRDADTNVVAELIRRCQLSQERALTRQTGAMLVAVDGKVLRAFPAVAVTLSE